MKFDSKDRYVLKLIFIASLVSLGLLSIVTWILRGYILPVWLMIVVAISVAMLGMTLTVLVIPENQEAKK